MKRLSNLLAALVFASLVIFMSCGGGDDTPAPTPEEIAADYLIGKDWNVSANDITFGGNVPDGDWDGPNNDTPFELAFTGSANGGSYTTDNVPDGFSDVWPGSGTWEFVTNNNGNVTGILRDGEVNMTVDVDDTDLSLTFTVTDPNSRTAGLYGQPWVFQFTVPQ